MLARSALASLRTAARQAAPARGYASSATASTSSSAPYFLGAGLAGSLAFYLSTRDQRLRLEESKAPAAASAGNAQGMKKDEAGAVKVEGDAALSPKEFRDFELTEVIPYNHNTSRFIFSLPDGTSSGLTVASALVTKAAKEGECLNDKGKPVIRPYTPVTAPDVEGKLELLVKHYNGGAFTEYLFKLKPGDKISMKGPIPKHPWKPNQYESVAMIAGGSGITPMWQVMQAIDANPEDKTKVTLLFSNVTEADILLRKEFEDLAARKPEQFSVQFVLDKPPKGWAGPTGYVDGDLVTRALEKFGTTPDQKDKIKVFVCGPPGQVKALAGAKKELGYTKEQVYKF
ncbi:hypothetical protein Rhopal_005348-T1 [Rhodotorula paludigena]|uniref:NADH-cytochrome b5 reductase n=1 Tax=Rhodotorula paludigena TaxID=86838 RepID=A0AAV5GUP7_9BASI|nr:hypothetical protein Rhopal_005348-T1 [Rhodotorula paludigena]